MDYKIQLLSFLLSFIFGIFFSFTSRFHYNIVYKLKPLLKYFLTFLYILDISLFYVLLMYYVNDGVVHIYFVCLTFVGYAVEKYLWQYVKKYVKLRQWIEKKVQK